MSASQPKSPFTGGAYDAPCEVPGPIIGAFRVVEPGEAATPHTVPIAPAKVRFTPERLGVVDRARTQAVHDMAELSAKRDRLLAEQDRIIRELAEVDAGLYYLERAIAAADAVCDRG